MEALKQRWPRALLLLLHESGDAGVKELFSISSVFISRQFFIKRKAQWLLCSKIERGFIGGTLATFSAHRTFSRLLESFLLIVSKKTFVKNFFKQNSDLATSEAATSKTILALA